MLLGLLVLVPRAAAEAPTPPKLDLQHAPKEALVARAIEVAQQHDLNTDHFVKVIGCETMHTWDPYIQSTYPNKADGGRELSFGLVQIHLPDHPDVSKEQATTVEFALDFMATEWEKGGQNQWSCYRKLVANGWRDG